MDGIFAAFRMHPLVAIGEHHRIEQELQFYAALVRNPRFAREVGNVVVEFGGAAHQDIIDRYVEGQDVPYADLRKVWTDTVGWTPMVNAIGYPNFFAQVREVNLILPPQQRIHVWLGEPVIDWARIKTHADWQALDDTRETYPAALIERQILVRKKKALVIYGGGHFLPPVPGSAGEKLQKAGWARGRWPRDETLGDIIRRDYPRALFVVLPYAGTKDRSCVQDIEKGMTNWPVPAFAAPLKSSELAAKLRVCNPLTIKDLNFPPGLTEAEQKQVWSFYLDASSQAEAMLYLGPSGSLTYSPYIPDLYLDQDYALILAQHYLLQTGQPYPAHMVQDYTSVTQKVWP
jgi:hypothetical protein